MFILENPYISRLLLETLEKNNFPLLENAIVSDYKTEYKLNLLDEKSALEFCNNQKELKIYSNSENSINWVLKNCPNSNIAKLINIAKNKYEFRKNLQSIFPQFFFKEVLFENLEKEDISNYPEQFIIKPSVGFLSMGVHKVANHSQWGKTVADIQEESKTFKENFPNEVLSSSSFIVEEIIQGDEFAVDAYYNQKGKPVILNIFQHPFVSEDDVSDRAYISSKEIIEANLKNFEEVLLNIGNALNIKNFPVHIEVIKRKDGVVIPVEINPMRFAGWCTTDLAYYAYGINIYEYFVNNIEPDWDKLLADKENKIYYFAMAERVSGIQKEKIKFDYEKLQKSFSKILDFRKIDYMQKPMFAVVFGEAADMSEITKILQMNILDFVEQED